MSSIADGIRNATKYLTANPVVGGAVQPKRPLSVS